MKNKFFRMTSIFALLFTFGISSNNATVDALWKIENDTLIIHNEEAMKLCDNYKPKQQKNYKHIVITGQINTFDVTILETMSRKCESVNLLNTTLDRIPDNSFIMMSNLKKFVFPERLKVIGRGAFYYCDNLQVDKLPSSLESIRNSAFMYCKNLNLTVSEKIKIGEGAFEYCPDICLHHSTVTSTDKHQSYQTVSKSFVSFLRKLVPKIR